MIAFLRDLLAFAEQFIPSPFVFFLKYRFSPADLDSSHCRIAPLSAAAASISSTSPSRRATSHSGNVIATIDIHSYNVNNVAIYSRIRTRRILHGIFSSGADIILLQETNPAWEEELVGSISIGQYQYRHFHHPGTTERAAGGSAILSQYPLANARVLDFTKDIPGSVFPALICEVHVPIEGSHVDGSEASSNSPPSNHNVILNISNVHLRPPVELNGSACLETARKTEPIRVSEVKELIQRNLLMKGGGPLANTAELPFDIIAGDFNEGDHAGALRYLTHLGYINALKQFVPMSKETHTWPFMRNMFTLRKRLDHILWHQRPLTNTFNETGEQEIFKLQCLGCGVMTGFEHNASDHQPVLSRFAIVKG